MTEVGVLFAVTVAPIGPTDIVDGNVSDPILISPDVVENFLTSLNSVENDCFGGGVEV